jgi:hypothetical protein
MATQYANGKIVTDGLVLCLNAADKNSYPGSGTTWYDVSNNNRNTILNGTVTYAPQTNAGILSVNNPTGTSQSDFFEFSNGNTSGYNPLYYSTVSVTVAFRWNNTNDYWERVFDFGRGGNNISTYSYNAVIFTRYSTSSDLYIITHGSYIGYQSVTFDTGLNLDIGTWQIITLTWEANSQKIYKNGSLFGSWSNAYSLIDHIGPYRTDERYFLGKSNWNDGGSRISYGAFMIHNKILSASEVTQIHNSLKTRYGL